MNLRNLKPMVEAILMAADSPVSIDRLIKLLDDENSNLPTKKEVCKIVEDLREDYSAHGVELIEVASGYRFRARADYGDRIVRLWEERRPRYSRALLETLAIIAYRQPITRGEIEHICVLERCWNDILGEKSHYIVERNRGFAMEEERSREDVEPRNLRTCPNADGCNQ